jgi:hypothetical protein
MIDENFDRTYQAGRADLHADIGRGLDRVAKGIGTTFRAIHAITFASPWAKSQLRRNRDVGCA